MGNSKVNRVSLTDLPVLYLSCLLCICAYGPLFLRRTTHSLSPYVLYIPFLILFHPSPFSALTSIPSLLFNIHSPMAAKSPQTHFQDYLPVMADKLGGDGLIDELCNGFNLLMDSDKGVITFDSLKRNSALLGLHGFTDDDLRSMLREGDFDGDGALNQLEFCVLMFRLSPELMEGSRLWLQEVLQQELKHSF